MSNIESLLFTYVDAVLKYEGLLKEFYKLGSLPYLNQEQIPKNGSVQIKGSSFDYNFHGSGCDFMIGGVEIRYAMYVDRENYIVTSPYDFMTFVNRTSNEKSTETQVAAWLETLNKIGAVSKIYDDYLVYEIEFAWYNAVKTHNAFKC